MTDYERKRYEYYKLVYAEFIKVYPFEIEDLDGEIWKCTNYYPEDYQISTFGRIKSFKNGKCKILKPYIDKDGYLLVDLCQNSKVKKCKVHRLVAKAFIPNPLNLPEINHKSGNKFDNYFENLEWCTSLENNRHAYNTGLNKSGEEHFNSKLTNEQADWCRRHYIPRHPEFGAAALARKFKISHMCMLKVVTGKTYTNI